LLTSSLIICSCLQPSFGPPPPNRLTCFLLIFLCHSITKAERSEARCAEWAKHPFRKNASQRLVGSCCEQVDFLQWTSCKTLDSTSRFRAVGLCRCFQREADTLLFNINIYVCARVLDRCNGGGNSNSLSCRNCQSLPLETQLRHYMRKPIEKDDKMLPASVLPAKSEKCCRLHMFDQ
jgi:hypothetical protein